MKDPSLIENDPELRRKVDKLRRQGLLYQRKEEDRQRNDRRLAYYDDRVNLNKRFGAICIEPLKSIRNLVKLMFPDYLPLVYWNPGSVYLKQIGVLTFDTIDLK